MDNLDGTILTTLSRLAQFMGVKPSGEHWVEQLKQKLATAKAGNIDRLEAFKDKIKKLEAQAIRKKEELDNTTSSSIQRIVGGEIERIFRDVDRREGQGNIISSNIENISVVQVKIEEYEAARERGLSENELDDIALELQDVFEELKTVNRASNDLDKIKPQTTEMDPVDIDNRMAEITGEQKTQLTLSTETEKRLRQLESDED